MKSKPHGALKKTILTSMILVPFVPFILALGIGYYYFTASLEDNTIASMHRIVRDHRQMIESFLMERKADLQFLAHTHSFEELQQSENRHVEIKVSDNGNGISAENMKKIFTPFFTTKPVGKGTGLGLSVCYGIIEKMDGSMAVASQEGVGTEYNVGPRAVVNFITTTLFNKTSVDAEQWELLCAQIMEQNMQMGALGKNSYLKRDLKWTRSNKIAADGKNFDKAIQYVKENLSDAAYLDLMQKALTLRKDGLKYADLSDRDRAEADKGAWAIKVALAMVVFVVICFLTECIPLPGVAFCIGLLLVFTGVVSRKEVTMLYWDDAVWFIMGSRMFAAAFVKTGVDKRVCLMMFRKLAVPNVRMFHVDYQRNPRSGFL